MYSNIGPKTTPSLISKGGYQIPSPLAWDEIDTPWEIGLSEHFYLLHVCSAKIEL